MGYCADVVRDSIFFTLCSVRCVTVWRRSGWFKSSKPLPAKGVQAAYSRRVRCVLVVTATHGNVLDTSAVRPGCWPLLSVWTLAPPPETSRLV